MRNFDFPRNQKSPGLAARGSFTFHLFFLDTAAALSFIEQVAVRPGAGQRQHQHIVLNPVDEQPVRLNVAFPMPRPIAGQVVIAVFIRQRFTHRQQRHDLFQQFDFLAALDCPLVVLFKAVVYLTVYFVFLIFSSRQTTRQGHCSPLQTGLLQFFPLLAWQQSFPC